MEEFILINKISILYLISGLVLLKYHYSIWLHFFLATFITYHDQAYALPSIYLIFYSTVISVVTLTLVTPNIQ